MLMFNPCEEIYGPWKRNEVQNHHTCIYHANFPACRALGTEFETYKILQVLNLRTGNKSRNPICKYTVRVHGQNMGP